METYVGLLRQSLDELRSAYPLLLDKLSQQVGDLLGHSLKSEAGRFEVSQRAGAVIGVSGDFRLDAFATRLKTASDSVEWLESIGLGSERLLSIVAEMTRQAVAEQKEPTEGASESPSEGKRPWGN